LNVFELAPGGDGNRFTVQAEEAVGALLLAGAAIAGSAGTKKTSTPSAIAAGRARRAAPSFRPALDQRTMTTVTFPPLGERPRSRAKPGKALHTGIEVAIAAGRYRREEDAHEPAAGAAG
jgi:hypothetical protein